MSRKESILPANLSGMTKTRWAAAITTSNPFPFSTRWSRWKPAAAGLNRTAQQSNKEVLKGVEWQSVFWLSECPCDRSVTKLSNNFRHRNKTATSGCLQRTGFAIPSKSGCRVRILWFQQSAPTIEHGAHRRKQTNRLLQAGRVRLLCPVRLSHAGEPARFLSNLSALLAL